MTPVIKIANEQIMRNNPDWVPTKEYRNQRMLEQIKELRHDVHFEKTPTNVRWDSPFFRDEDGKYIVAVRTDFGRDEPGSVMFEFDERGEPIGISGYNVETVDLRNDNVAETPSFESDTKLEM